MPALNFKRRFVEPIQQRRKRHTIRANRKVPIRPGDELYLYCGMRTKECFPILEGPQQCTKVDVINIEENGSVAINCNWLAPDERERLAEADGFENFTEMMLFWTGRLPFTGSIIHWR